MTNDPRLDEYHNYRFEMYCADQAEITSLRTQLAEVARERDTAREDRRVLLVEYDRLTEELDRRRGGSDERLECN